MKFQSESPYPAMLFRNAFAEDRMAAAALMRVTYDITPEGLRRASDQPWLLSPGPWEGPRGPMDGDDIFCRGGVDVFLWGEACAPRGRTVRRMTVRIAIGEAFRRDVLVMGDRTWVRRRGGFVPSEPAYFSSLSLGPENAFGGKDTWDGLEVPFNDNPAGKGYRIEEDTVEGTPLPNLEEPDAPVSRWDDQPAPVLLGPCPMQSRLRIQNGVEFDDQGVLRSIKPRFFNAAHPRMVAERLHPGDPVRLEGVSPDGPVTFTLPEERPEVVIRFDDEVHTESPFIDQVGIDLIDRKVFLTWRHPFRYTIYPLQQRSCEIRFPATK